MQRQIVLDTETTGLSAEAGDRIIELGCVELVGRKLTGNNLHFYFNPDRDSHEDAIRVHGISNDFLRDKPRFKDLAHDILRYLAGAELIIHNAAFDVAFLDKELEGAGYPRLSEHVTSVTDTLGMAKALYPGRRNSLDALCDRLGVDNSARTLHGALLDAELLADVYIHLTRGQEALLIDLIDAGEGGGTGAAVDLRGFELAVIAASVEEIAAHEATLAAIDKASGGKAVWLHAPNAMH